MADPTRRHVVTVLVVCLCAAVAERAGAPRFETTVAALAVVALSFMLWASDRGGRG